MGVKNRYTAFGLETEVLPLPEQLYRRTVSYTHLDVYKRQGVNTGADGKICGDADFSAVEPVVQAVTPVPGGVGAVTSCILMEHVVDAAVRSVQKPLQ